MTDHRLAARIRRSGLALGLLVALGVTLVLMLLCVLVQSWTGALFWMVIATGLIAGVALAIRVRAPEPPDPQDAGIGVAAPMITASRGGDAGCGPHTSTANTTSSDSRVGDGHDAMGASRPAVWTRDRWRGSDAEFRDGWSQAQALRMMLLQVGPGALTVQPPGDLVLREQERVHLRTTATYRRRHTDGLLHEDQPHVMVEATTHRLVTHVQAGVLTYEWPRVTALHCDLQNWTIELHFDVAIPLVLSGPSAATLAVYATATLRGIAALATDTDLAALGS